MRQLLVAGEVDDAKGLIVEGTFTSIADVVSHFRWGWLPVAPPSDLPISAAI